jgi:hypothetical protein
MENAEWFDEISIAYARNFRELETARESFEQQNGRILGQLADYARDCAIDRNLKAGEVTGGTGRTGPWKNVWIEGQFAEAVGLPQASSIACGFGRGDFWGDGKDIEFGFVPYLSFSLKKSACSAMGVLAPSKVACPSATDILWGNGSLYFVHGHLGPGDETFLLKGARAVIDHLVDCFPQTDTWMAKAYRDKGRAADK